MLTRKKHRTTKRIKHLIITALLGAIPFLALAQGEPPEPIFKKNIVLNRFATQQHTFPFNVGDTIIYTIKKASRFPLASVQITEGGPFNSIEFHKKPENIINKELVIKNTGDYSFIFRGQKVFKSMTSVIIHHYPKQKQIFYYDRIVHDTIVTKYKVKETVYDTIPKEGVMENFSLDGTMNIYGNTRKCIEIPLPEDSLAYYWAYWIGIGPKALEEITALEAEPPPEWEPKQAKDAVTAYGMYLLTSLPRVAVLDEVEVHFLGEEGQQAFLAHQPYKKTEEIQLNNRHYGKIDLNEYQEIAPLSVCFENQNGISPVSIDFRIVPCLVKGEEVEKEEESVEIQQRIEKVPY